MIVRTSNEPLGINEYLASELQFSAEFMVRARPLKPGT